jgi:hypothetical protein
LKALVTQTLAASHKTTDGIVIDENESQLVIDDHVKSRETLLYRGMSTKQKAIGDLAKMLAGLAPHDYIPSWRMSNLKRLRPELSLKEIAPLMDQDYELWSQRSQISLIADAHTGGMEALYPLIRSMVAVSFRGLESHFPDHIKQTISSQKTLPDNHLEELQSKAFIFFDPVLSFSLFPQVAETFAQKDDNYIIQAKDVKQRRCRKEGLKESRCISLSYDFADEAEIGIFGYVAADELQLVKKGSMVLARGLKTGQLLLINTTDARYWEVVQAEAHGSCPVGYMKSDGQSDGEKLILDGLGASGFSCLTSPKSLKD